MMKNDDHYVLEDGQDQDFEGVTLQIGSEDAKPKYSTVELSAAANSVNGQIKNESDSTKLIQNDGSTTSKTRPSTLSVVPWAGQSAKDFFSYRNDLLTNAVIECTKEFTDNDSEELIASWLLTEVSLWDQERERLILVTKSSLFIIKYDFIALKILEHRKINLEWIENIFVGYLSYPPTSLIKYETIIVEHYFRHLDGLATGVASAVKHNVYRPLQEKIAGIPNCANAPYIGNSFFEPRSRELSGVRLQWGAPMTLFDKWNPFVKETPVLTFASHPLFWHKEGGAESTKMYNVDDLTSVITQALDKKIKNFSCQVIHRPILIENYVNIASLIHNKNSLGFFKVRGKFSF